MIGTRTIEIIAPAEGGKLLFESMSGREALGGLFEFHVELLSDNGDIPIASMLGKPFSIELSRGIQGPRWWNGMIARFAMEEWTGNQFRYRAELRPTAWLMTRASNSRIFQKVRIPDLVLDLLKAQGVTAKKLLGRASYAEWEYLVQYNETDFNFVSRLMEQEGISYYFTHEKGEHTMVLIDALTAHDPVPGYEKITFSTVGDRIGGAIEEHEYISKWSLDLEVAPGAYAAKDFDFENPRAPLLSTDIAPTANDHAKQELYEYPGVYIDSGERDEYAKRRLEEKQVDYEQVHGDGNASGITPGFRFKLIEHPAPKQNREVLVIAASYTLTSTQHGTGAADAEQDFLCSFVAIDSKRPFRTTATTPKPHVAGPQTAIVVGPKDEEIWTDKYGRVKVQFHWDRKSSKDEKSSCFVRVSQVWAGSGWGAMHVPRIGQEVIIDFLEGDPDRPIITGRVYNGANKPPYVPADNSPSATKSTIRSHSTKGGGPDNYNELSFEDKKGEEEVGLQAERNLKILVKNDEHREVKNDRTKDIGHDETTTVGNNRTETVGKEEDITIGGGRTENVAKDEDITIGGGRTESVTKDESITIGGGRSESVGKNESISIGGGRTENVTKDESITIGGGRTENVTKDEEITIGGKRTENIGKDNELTVAKKLSITAEEIEIRTASGSSSITMKKNGDITIKGKTVVVEGSGDINLKASGKATMKGSNVGHN
jgi:type VI secretion system secreted protein VgrG